MKLTTCARTTSLQLKILLNLFIRVTVASLTNVKWDFILNLSLQHCEEHCVKIQTLFWLVKCAISKPSRSLWKPHPPAIWFFPQFIQPVQRKQLIELLRFSRHPNSYKSVLHWPMVYARLFHRFCSRELTSKAAVLLWRFALPPPQCVI